MLFRSEQRAADERAEIFGPHLTFVRWMAAQRYAARLTSSPSSVPMIPARRPVLHWRRFPAAHDYLLCHLAPYQALRKHDRRIYVWRITAEVMMDGYFMEEFDDAGFSPGDVKRVSVIQRAVTIGCRLMQAYVQAIASWFRTMERYVAAY